VAIALPWPPSCRLFDFRLALAVPLSVYAGTMADVQMEVDEKEKARIDEMHEKLEQGKVRCSSIHARPRSHAGADVARADPGANRRRSTSPTSPTRRRRLTKGAPLRVPAKVCTCAVRASASIRCTRDWR
jgi:hypothetical protein